MKKITSSEGIMPLERLLVSLDNSPWSAVYRMATGFVTLPAWSRLRGQDESGWALVLFLLLILSMLRVIPAVVRRLVPFSDTARTIWAERRQMAKRYDSYQWQKLFWIGLGLALYMVLSYQRLASGMAVALICLVSGALGLVRWQVIIRQLDSSVAPAKAPCKFGLTAE